MPDLISLCMIVRNEAAMLPRFFAAATGLWDDLCVVDTGSTDATVSILQAHGARIFHHPWSDDFSAARNAGLEHAHGDWVVFLDPDEICSPELVASIREARREASLGAATITIRNTLANNHVTVTHLLRMFRNVPQIRFEHAIHEDVITSCLAYLRASSRTLRRLAGHVEHVGYTYERARAMDKKSRDVRILHAALAENPDDLYCWFKLLEVARYWDDSELLADTARKVAPRVKQMQGAELQVRHFSGEMLTLVAKGLFADDASAALHFLAPYAPHVTTSAAYFLRCAELCEALGELNAAQRAYTHCLSLRDATANCQLASVRPLLGSARVALLRGDAQGALSYVDAALAENHRDPEALLALATLSKALGGPRAAREMAAAYVDAYGDTEELRQAFAEVGV